MKKTYKIILLSSILAGGEAIASQPQEDDNNESLNRSELSAVKRKESISLDEHQAEVTGLLLIPKPELGQVEAGVEGSVEGTLKKSAFINMESTQKIDEDKIYIENLEKTRARHEELKRLLNMK